MRSARSNRWTTASGPILFGRYRDTRAWRSPVGTILSMGMEYNIIHHLFPRIPLFQTGPAYHAMRQLLDERGCRNDRSD